MKRKQLIQRFFILFIIILSVLNCANQQYRDEDSLRIAGVQLEINQSFYSSEQVFENRLKNIVDKEYNAFKPDVIIFPEYTGVFLALTPYFKEADGINDYRVALAFIQNKYETIKDMKDIFIIQSGNVENILNRVYGTLSKKYGIYILGGTYFAYENGELFNRAVVYEPSGKVIYEQDKVYLTPTESDIIKLTPGRISKAKGFYIKGRKIGLTICRDTYFDIWEDIMNGNYLWIDIKANGTAFSEKEQQSFLRALPARITNSDVSYGMTVCLTGKVLSFFWEGESSVIKKQNHGYKFLLKADTYKKQDIIEFIFR